MKLSNRISLFYLRWMRKVIILLKNLPYSCAANREWFDRVHGFFPEWTASFFSMNEQTVVGYGMVADKRISIGDRLRYIPMGYFNKNNIGTITGIVTTTLGNVEGAAPVALVNMIGGFFNSIVLILFLLCFNWQLGLVAFTGVLCYLLITETATRKSTSAAEKYQLAQRNLVEAVLEYIQGMGIVKSFGFEQDSSKSVATAIRDSSKGNLRLVHSVAPFIALQQLVVRVFRVLMLMLSIYLFTAGTFSLAWGVLFVIAGNRHGVPRGYLVRTAGLCDGV